MTSVPFFGVFLGWIAGVYWARWLSTRGGGELATYGFWGGGALLMMSQAAAAASIVWEAPGSPQIVVFSSWAGAVGAAALLIADAVLTIRWLRSR